MKLYTLVLTYLISVTSLSQTPEATLSGDWKVDLAKTILNMTPSEKQTYNGLSEETRNSVVNSFQGRIFRFSNNYTVTLSFMVNKAQKDVKGKWAYSHDKVLSITIESQTHFYDVIWESESEITLHYKTITPGAIISSLSLSRAK